MRSADFGNECQCFTPPNKTVLSTDRYQVFQLSQESSINHYSGELQKPSIWSLRLLSTVVRTLDILTNLPRSPKIAHMKSRPASLVVTMTMAMQMEMSNRAWKAR